MNDDTLTMEESQHGEALKNIMSSLRDRFDFSKLSKTGKLSQDNQTEEIVESPKISVLEKMYNFLVKDQSEKEKMDSLEETYRKEDKIEAERDLSKENIEGSEDGDGESDDGDKKENTESKMGLLSGLIGIVSAGTATWAVAKLAYDNIDTVSKMLGISNFTDMIKKFIRNFNMEQTFTDMETSISDVISKIWGSAPSETTVDKVVDTTPDPYTTSSSDMVPTPFGETKFEKVKSKEFNTPEFITKLDVIGKERNLPKGLLGALMLTESFGENLGYHYAGGESNPLYSDYGLFGIKKDYTGKQPGFGITPLRGDTPTPEEQARFAADLVQKMTEKTGSLEGGIAAFHTGLGGWKSEEGTKYVQVVRRRFGQLNIPRSSVEVKPANKPKVSPETPEKTPKKEELEKKEPIIEEEEEEEVGESLVKENKTYKVRNKTPITKSADTISEMDPDKHIPKTKNRKLKIQDTIPHYRIPIHSDESEPGEGTDEKPYDVPSNTGDYGNDWASESDLTGLYFTHSYNNYEQKQILKTLAVKVQSLKNELGVKSFTIVSGYRSPAYNAGIKGAAKHSLHMHRMAVDISTSGYSVSDKVRFIRTASKLGFGGIGVYMSQNFIHVDIGPVRSWNMGGLPSDILSAIKDHLNRIGMDTKYLKPVKLESEHGETSDKTDTRLIPAESKTKSTPEMYGNIEQKPKSFLATAISSINSIFQVLSETVKPGAMESLEQQIMEQIGGIPKKERTPMEPASSNILNNIIVNNNQQLNTITEVVRNIQEDLPALMVNPLLK